MNLGEDLLRFKNHQKYIIFDFETESLNLYLARPWQLAFALYQGNKKIKSYDLYIDWPDIQVSKEAAIITRFNINHYRSAAKPPKEVLALFEKYLYDPDYLIIGHNILNYDIMIHNTLRRLCGLPADYSYLERCLDTNCLAKAHKKEIKYGGEDRLLWQFKLLNFREKGLKTSLSTMCKDFSIDVDPNKQHDAIYDIDINMQVFQKLIWSFEI